MGFAMNCDRCGRFMKNVAAKDLKKLPNEIVCKECLKVESIARTQIEHLKKMAYADFEKMANNYKLTLAEALKDIVNGNTEVAEDKD